MEVNPNKYLEWSPEGVNTGNFVTTPAAKLAPNVMPCIPMYLIGMAGVVVCVGGHLVWAVRDLHIPSARPTA